MSDKVLKALKKLLDFLPFDGSKAKIGVFLAALAAAGIDPVALAKEVAANHTPIGLIILAVGVAHKILKAKFPDKVK